MAERIYENQIILVGIGRLARLALTRENVSGRRSMRHSHMRFVFGFLYAAFPAVLLMAQATRPDYPGNATPPPTTPSVEPLVLLPKSFPPEMMLPSSTADRRRETSASAFCVYQNPDRKSVSVKRCSRAPVGLHLIAPFKAAAPERKPVRSLPRIRRHYQGNI